eukprot:TRINITY_DN4627_c0_g1_i16.p2 TRINITY_DN4627_c0_g1~~TRINITY_DN4627_c0_g1_i16.p2  ORF type:complete len:293 (-),score=47.71 TRINITY_DN4627_c0_g1_i16:1846-2673(-)
MYKDQVVWITGASSGIGRALAFEFAAQQAKLIISSRNFDRLEEVKNSFGPEVECIILTLDLEQYDTLHAKSQEAISIFGRIDVVVHNGGISQRSVAVDFPLEDYVKIMNINFFGAVAITKALLPYLIEQGSGHFVVMSSISGKVGTPIRTGYSASKFALHGFFEALRAEISQYNIQVTMVCPGYVATNVSFNALAAGGQVYGKFDETQSKGLTAQACARQVVKAAARKNYSCYPGGMEMIILWVKWLLPPIVPWLMEQVFSKFQKDYIEDSKKQE